MTEASFKPLRYRIYKATENRIMAQMSTGVAQLSSADESADEILVWTTITVFDGKNSEEAAVNLAEAACRNHANEMKRQWFERQECRVIKDLGYL